MHIERVQIEEGFLDGLDVSFVPGLNVIIGARGTGKTSLIELVRFCLGVKGYTTDSRKSSLDHALSVLGSGQVTVTLSEAGRQVIVTRTAADESRRAAGPFVTPIIFSQKEIETVGLQAGGRLRLLDSFIGDQRETDAQESEATSEVRSLTAEAETLRREIDELSRQVKEIPTIDQQLTELAPKEEKLAKVSVEANEKKTKLDTLSTSIAAAAVGVDAVKRFQQAIALWRASLSATLSAAPSPEAWPEGAGADPLKASRARVQRAQEHVRSALEEFEHVDAETSKHAHTFTDSKLKIEEQARQLRTEIEALQTGAGTVVRQGQQLRERKAQLESLHSVLIERQKKLQSLLANRDAALDRLDTVRENRFNARTEAATGLAATLGPRIRIRVGRAGQFENFSAAIADILRGSGLRYSDLSSTIAERVSPRELLEAVDTNDFDLLADAVGISKDRAVRALSHLSELDLGALATVAVDDIVFLQLLDGANYKNISELSTGQRCTVVLPLVMRHTERVLIVDQPEDHIDNAFIADTLILSVLARDPNGQIIFSTHNANIPVLGNADRVLQLGSDGRRGFPVVSSSLDDPAVVSAITVVMEGGAEAFEKRASFYSKHKKS